MQSSFMIKMALVSQELALQNASAEGRLAGPRPP